jgi:hypothetical protein
MGHTQAVSRFSAFPGFPGFPPEGLGGCAGLCINAMDVDAASSATNMKVFMLDWRA